MPSQRWLYRTHSFYKSYSRKFTFYSRNFSVDTPLSLIQNQKKPAWNSYLHMRTTKLGQNLCPLYRECLLYGVSVLRCIHTEFTRVKCKFTRVRFKERMSPIQPPLAWHMEVLIHLLNLVSRNQDKTCTAFDFNRRASVQLKRASDGKS